MFIVLDGEKTLSKASLPAPNENASFLAIAGGASGSNSDLSRYVSGDGESSINRMLFDVLNFELSTYCFF